MSFGVLCLLEEQTISALMDINRSRSPQHQISHKALVSQTTLRNPRGWQGLLFATDKIFKNKILAFPIKKLFLSHSHVLPNGNYYSIHKFHYQKQQRRIKNKNTQAIKI